MRALNSVDAAGSVAYAYDAAGQLSSETRTFAGVDTPLTTAYTYFRDGKLKSLTYPTARRVDYGYSANSDRLSSMIEVTNSTQTSLLASVSYNAAGQPLSRSLGNNVTGTGTYNARNQLTAIGASNNSTSLLNLAYGYGTTNNDGRIRQRTDNNDTNSAHSVNYDYDVFGRLHSATAANNSWSLNWP